MDSAKSSRFSPAVLGLAALLSLGTSACTFHYRGDMPKPSDWRQVERPTGRGRIELTDVRFEPTGPRSGVLTGALKSAAVEVHTFEARTESEISKRSFLIFTEERLGKKEATRNHERQLREIPVKRLAIENPFGPDATADVGANGAFEASLTFDPPHVALAPEEGQLALSLFEYVSPPAEVFVRPAEVAGEKFTPAPVRLPIWRFELDEEKAAAFARRQTTRVEIHTADMLSRTRVAGEVRVVCVGAPTRGEIQRRLAQAFHSEQAAREMMRYVPPYLAAGQSVSGGDGALAFQAAVGGSYRIEALHPDYVYFDRVITPKASPRERKIVLLPEKGKKIRVERVDDSLGGTLVPDRP